MNATILLDELRERGVELAVDGDRLRYRAPRGAITPDLREAMRRHKSDLLAALAHPTSPSIGTDPWVEWPVSLPSIGTRVLGSLTPCLWCGIGTWVRYGAAPTCVDCAKKVLGVHTRKDARALLHGLLAIWSEMDETAWRPAEVAGLKDYIVSFWNSYPDVADQWFSEWRAAHPEAHLC